MMDRKIAHFCQNCSAANEAGETSCHKCGTRLMIVTFPASHKHEQEVVPPSYYEDHLLERVSLLEFRLKQMSEQLAMAYEFISRQSESFEQDHLLISSFMESVLDVNPNLSEKITEDFSSTFQRKKNELQTKNKQQRTLHAILSNHQKQNIDLFTHLVNEGISLLDNKEEKQAFRTLDRAFLLSPENVPLQLFIAEKLFFLNKFDSAKTYLENAYKLEPQNKNLMLLLGSIYADEFDAENSRKMLSFLTGFPETIVCANYIWGILAASEENWTEAIIAFKESLEIADFPEISYLIGSAYFQIKNYKNALKYLESAVLKDQKFADAWFMVYVTYKCLDKPTKAENARQMAFESKEIGAKSLKFMSKNNNAKLEYAIPFLHLAGDKKNLLTNCSLRMSNFLKKLISDSID